MHTKNLLTSAIALALWAPQAAAQEECCTSSQKASPVTVRLLQDCEAAEAKASTVARFATPAAAPGVIGRLVNDATVSQDDAIRTLAALGYVADDADAASSNERGYLGVVMDVEDGAMIVRRVMEGSPAAKAGLKPGDRITRLGDHKVRNQESLSGFLQGLKAGSEIELRIVRDGWVKEMGVGLAPLSSIEVDESPLVEEIAEEPIIQDLEIVELQPAKGRRGEWVEAGESDAQVWITDLTKPGAQGEQRRIEFKGHDGARIVELEDITGLAELKDLGIDLKGLEGLHGLSILGDGHADKLKKRIHMQLMGELGDSAHGEHEIEIHVEHDGENLDLDALKDRIKTRVRKQIGPESHSGHDAPDGAHGIQVHAEHGGDVKVKTHGKVIMIDEDGEKHEFEFGGDATNVFEWNSKPGDAKGLKHVIVERLHGDGAGSIEMHADGDVRLFGKPGTYKKLDANAAPSWGLFHADDDDDRHDDDDDDHHDADDHDDDDHHGATRRRVIRGLTQAPSTGAYFFDATEGNEDHESIEEEIEIHFEANSSDEKGQHRIMLRGDAGQRAGNIRFGDHDDALGKLREELSKLREEIGRLRAEIKKMHR